VRSKRWRRVVAIAAAITALYAAPYVFSSYITSILSLILIAALLAGSVNLLAGLGGLVSIGHGGIAAAAAYGVAWAAEHDMGLGAQLGLAAALTLTVGVVYAVTTMRTSGIVFLMITLALGMVVFGLALKLSSLTGGQNGLTGIARPWFATEWWQFYFFTAGIFLVGTFAMWLVSRSPLGLTLRGIRESESRMRSLGYSVAGAKFMAVMVSAVFAGLAGVLAVWNSEFMSPSAASFSRSALAVVMVIVGGTGILLGPLVGAAVVVGTEQWLSSYVDRWPTVLGVLFILIVLFAPRGIVGTIQDTIRRVSRRRPIEEPSRVDLPKGIAAAGAPLSPATDSAVRSTDRREES
jgi:branched-chain amino acid transport system permease protein